MSSVASKIQRSNLPIPDQPHVGLTTYDAKDSDTKSPLIRELRSPKGAPEANWVQTIPFKGWNMLFRLYGPFFPVANQKITQS